MVPFTRRRLSLAAERFQVINPRIIQKGPAFKLPLETSVDFSSGQVTVRYTDDDGKQKEISERMELPPDIANGIVPTLLKNIQPTTSPVTVSMVAATPKLRLVKLAITSQGEEPSQLAVSTARPRITL